MEFIFFFYYLSVISVFVAPVLYAIGNYFAKPYMNGTKQIDRFKYPTLARAQRILRASNVKRRELEAKKRLKEITDQKNDWIVDNANSRLKMLDKVREEHNKEIVNWSTDFQAVTYEEDQRKRKAQEEIIAAQRAKELEVWQASEKTRIANFIADQKALQAEETRKATELLQSRENDIQALRKYYVPDHKSKHFGFRLVNVHGLYVRKLPVKSSRLVDNLTTGAMVSVNGWIEGEELYGNPIWLKLSNDAGWIWSGGVDNKSTSGLVNYSYMNEPGDSFTMKSADGAVIQTHAAPSEMQALIAAEISALKREKERLALEMRGSNPWEMRSMYANMITSDRITVGPSINSVR